MLSSSSAPIRRTAFLLLMLFSMVVAIGAYFQALDYPFFSDDSLYLINNTKLAGLAPSELWRLIIEPYNPLEFLPLRDLSYWFDLALFGLNPSAFRVSSILLYLLCLPLVFGSTLAIWRFFRPADAASAPWAAAIVTALFTLHPAHVEAVVWASGRKDVLAALFSLLSVWFAMQAKRVQGLPSRYAVAALAALLAAMLSKATSVAVAAIVAMLWISFWRDVPPGNRRKIQLLWPVAGLLLAGGVLLVFSAHSNIKEPFDPGLETGIRALAILGWLARLAISPEHRHFLYPVLEDTSLPVMLGLGAAVLGGGAAGAVLSMRRKSMEGFACAAFVLLCLPYVQLIPFGTISLVSDRFLIIAVWPVALLAVALTWRLNPGPRAAVLLVIALPWAFQTIERPRDWRNYETMTDADLHSYPGFYAPAVEKIINTQFRPESAREAMETAKTITVPEIREVMIKLIGANHAAHIDAEATGNPQMAMMLLWKVATEYRQPALAKWDPPMNVPWERVLGELKYEWGYLAKQFPDDASVRYNAGLWMMYFHSYEAAATHFRAATGMHGLPAADRGPAFRNLGLALMYGGHAAEAETALQAALQQTPPDTAANCDLSNLYRSSGRIEEAARAAAACASRPPPSQSAPGPIPAL